MASHDPWTPIPLAEPVSVLPVQVASDARRLPEQELMLAVLREAIDEYRALLVRPAASTTRHAFVLRRWFGSDDVEWPFSFRNICDALDIDRSRLRARLRAWHGSTDAIRGPHGRTRLSNRSMRGTRTKVVPV